MNATTNDLPENFGDAGDVAALLKLSKSWVYKSAERGEIPCIRVGSALRFDMTEVRAFFAARRVPVPTTSR